LVDRPTMTFRTLAVAAIAVLLLAPEAVVHPSFQMSFAATLALVAGYQHGLPKLGHADSSLGARVALWGVREIVSLIFASLLAAGTLWAIRTPVPDVLVAQGTDLVGVRSAGGNFSIIKRGGDSFAVREWLAADADPRTPADPSLAKGVSCDEIGCIAQLADGTIVTLALAAEAYADDCRAAGLIVTARRAPPDCAAMVVDRVRRANS